MRSWFNKGVKSYLASRFKRRVFRFREHADTTQENVLQSLLSRASNTQYGKAYQFSKINSIATFNKNVPLTQYGDIKSHIYDMMDGRKDVLWPGRVNWYAKSSGTTSERSKYIPITDDVLKNNHVASSWDTMSILYNDDPQSKIFNKKSLIMGGSLAKWEYNSKVWVGDVSAILLHRMPLIGRPFYTPDFHTALLQDWETKIERMTQLCMKEDVVMFGGVPTWTIVLFNKMMETVGAKNMLDIWPNAQYYIHGGVGFEPYKKQFERMFPTDEFKYYEVYNASEGYFAVQDGSDKDGMLLMMGSDIYYEFFELHELDKESPTPTPLQELELNKNYAMAISSSSGLWRYLPGDTVCFTSLSPYRIKVSGRTKHFINVFGEEVMVGNTDKALARTIESLPAIVSEYTVAPIFMDGGSKGGHLWLIEFEKNPDNLEAFEVLLDNNLKSINSDYAAKRFKDLALQRLKIKQVPKNTFHNWLKSKGKIGGQNKVPRLYNNRKYVDELLQFVTS